MKIDEKTRKVTKDHLQILPLNHQNHCVVQSFEVRYTLVWKENFRSLKRTYGRANKKGERYYPKRLVLGKNRKV